MQNHLILPVLSGRVLTAQEIKEYSDWKEARYRQLNEGKIKLLAGARELLADLKQNGYRLAIGTSTPPENLDFIMTHTGIAEFFDAFVNSADVQRSKPDPDTFLKAADKLGMKPSLCVVVEDAVPGVQAGKAGGMAVIAVTNTRPADELAHAGADRIVDSLTELTADDFDALLMARQS
jgi:beta-phosphoglucomutase